jgi:hypothetical protein
MTRREVLVAMIQALLLALFPWLRTERGLLVAGRAAETIVPVALDYGHWTQIACYQMVRDYHFRWT